LLNQKQELRNHLLTKLRMMSQITKSDKTIALCLNLEKHLNSLTDCRIIGCFNPMLHEPDWSDHFVHYEKFYFALPYRLKEVGEMNFQKVDFNNIKSGKSAFVKKSDNEVVPDILMIPGVAFTKKMERLGLGKGYYDRYLAKFPLIKKIGICFEEQIINNVFCEIHDMKMDAIITDKKIYKS